MNIIYVPFENSTNKYIDISQGILKSCDCRIYEFLIKDFLLNHKKYDAIFLNWYDSIYGDPTEKELIKEILKRKLRLIFIRLLGVKVVFTFHNRTPHDIKGSSSKRISSFLKWICKNSDYIIILSQSSREHLASYLSETECLRKIMYIPHPNYIGVYSEELQSIEFQRSTKFNLLFVGQIKPYKNIELILEIAKKYSALNMRFVIAGSCSNQDYRNTLMSVASKIENVELQFGFIPDDKLEVMVRQNDIVVLPYNMESSMNSGTAILAFSNGRTVICPRIDTIKEYDLKNTYSYTYDDDKQHLEALEEQILAAYHDWKENRIAFEQKGIEMFNSVKKNNSVEVLRNKYIELLNLINNKKQ